MTAADHYKKQAGEAAVRNVQSGMIVGLGHGSTAIWAVRAIAELIQSGELTGVQGIPASEAVELEARRLAIPLTNLNRHPLIDLTIDGADAVSPTLDLIKGGGGALLREKIVAQASKREIIVVDESKLSAKLGTKWAVPVEIVPFGWQTQVHFFQDLGAKPELRLNQDGSPFKTDQGNMILDCNFGPIDNPAKLAELIKMRTGVVDHGLFLNCVSEVIVAGENGIRHLKQTG